MSVELRGVSRTGANEVIHVEQVPTACPQCHRAIAPSTVFLITDREPEDTTLRVVFRCPASTCGVYFFAEYQWILLREASGRERRTFLLIGVSPSAARPYELPKAVAELSPRFLKIMNQVSAAEASGLDELVGMGMRKALEILVKDFAINEHPEKSDSIQKTPIGRVIEDYCDDPKLRAIAARATWLGNDETHYMRVWEDRDVGDLRTLLRLGALWIERHLVTKEYEKGMPDAPRP